MSVPAPVLPRSSSNVLVWLLLLLLLVLCLPQFLSMGLWADVTLYDVCARNMLRGGIHYRDLVETNLPGMPWLHIAVRSLFGWGSISIRVVDLAFFGLTVWLLQRALAATGASRTTQAWTVLALVAFYFSTCEQCHCQRDVWMLVPALAALTLRRSRLAQLVDGTASVRQLLVGGFVEGLCWGIAIWIKPHILIPLLACQFLAGWLAWRAPTRSVRRLLADGAGLLTGGLLVGAAGLAWLLGSGTWPYLLHTIAEWDSHYLEGGGEDSKLLYRLLLLWDMFLPWSLAHLVALPLAAATVYRFCRRPVAGDATERHHDTARALLAVLYLSWFAQAVFLQKGYWYIRLPLIVLAVPILAEHLGRLRISVALGTAVTLGAASLALMHPMLRPARLALWARCCTQPGNPELEDELALNPEWAAVHWADLARVRDFLKDRDLHDGDLLCYNDFTHPLYLDLGQRPAGRFLHWSTMRYLFPSHAEAIDAELRAQHPRYIVTDVRSCDFYAYYLEFEAGGSNELALPPKTRVELTKTYPWCEPIVFRSGPYFVHEVTVSVPSPEP